MVMLIIGNRYLIGFRYRTVVAAVDGKPAIFNRDGILLFANFDFRRIIDYVYLTGRPDCGYPNAIEVRNRTSFAPHRDAYQAEQ